MASGSFNLTRTGSTSSYITFRCNWSSTSNGSAANSSTVTVNIVASKGSGSTSNTWGNQSTTVSVDGSSQSNSGSFTLKPGSSITLLSKTWTVAHNSDGTKNITISANVGGNVMYGNGSATVTLDKIPRYATSNQSLSSKTETSISMNWSSDSIVDYIWYSTNNGSSWTGINVTDGTSGSYTISNLTANTTYNIKTRVRRKDSQLTTDSSTLSVATYNYPYANSTPNFTIGNKLTLGIYNPLGRSITVNILGADGSQISNDTTSGTSITGYNNATIQNRLYASIPNSQSGQYQVKVTYGSIVKTVNGGTYSVNKSECTPSITSGSYQDTNSASVSVTTNNQLIVRNQSKVQFTASGLTSLNSATVSSCSLSINNNTYSMTISGNSATVNNIVIDSATNLTGVFTITDSRGLTATKNINVTMEDWTLPSAIITCQRQNNFYSATDINVDADYASINGKNTITITYSYRKVDEPEGWTGGGTLQDGITSTFTIDNNYEWIVNVELRDAFGVTEYYLTVPKGMPIAFFDRLNNSISFNCFPKEQYSVSSSDLPIDNVKFIGSQVLYDYFTTSSSGTTSLLGAYNYSLLDGLFEGVNIPSDYTRAYRITAQIRTGGNNKVNILLNNISSNYQYTYSQTSYRNIISTRIFKESEIVLEDTFNYESNAQKGCNLKVNNAAAKLLEVFNITVQGYLVKSTTNLEEVGSYDLSTKVNLEANGMYVYSALLITIPDLSNELGIDVMQQIEEGSYSFNFTDNGSEAATSIEYLVKVSANNWHPVALYYVDPDDGTIRSKTIYDEDENE